MVNSTMDASAIDPEQKLAEEVDDEAKELFDEFPETLDDVDLANVDLALPDDYRLRLAANQRVVRAKEATQIRWNMVANKVANPSNFEELQREYNWRIWQIAYIDKYFPAAKAIAVQMLEDIAYEEMQEADAKSAKRLKAKADSKHPTPIRR